LQVKGNRSFFSEKAGAAVLADKFKKSFKETKRGMA
jgi:hypothetical protein